MATITKSASAPTGAVTLSAGQATFTLNDTTKSYDTEDQALISAALSSSAFSVEIPPPAAAEGDSTPVDPNDPRLNRAADHLSAQASPQAIAAAEANEKAIKDVASAQQNVVDAAAPTVAELLADQFIATGTDVGPVVPFEAPAPAAPEPTSTVTAAPETTTTSASADTTSTPTGAGS